MCYWQNWQLKEIIVVRNGIKQTKEKFGRRGRFAIDLSKLYLVCGFGTHDIMNVKNPIYDGIEQM